MDNNFDRMGRISRWLVGCLGIGMVILVAFISYVSWTFHNFYFRQEPWPGVGWFEVLGFLLGLYLFVAGFLGRWRIPQ